MESSITEKSKIMKTTIFRAGFDSSWTMSISRSRVLIRGTIMKNVSSSESWSKSDSCELSLSGSFDGSFSGSR